MEIVSEGGGEDTNHTSEGKSKSKRQMKTPFQLETLEKAYAKEMYPLESTRAELSQKLGLSDRQLQMWFCHKRSKDKKDALAKKSLNATVSMPDSPMAETALDESASDHGSGSGSGSGLGLSPIGCRELPGMVPQHAKAGMIAGDDVALGQRHYASTQSILLRAIAAVEAQLDEPLREDGPLLGVEFDPLPPDAFGRAIGGVVMPGMHKQPGRLYEGENILSNKAAMRSLHEHQINAIQRDSWMNDGMDIQFNGRPFDLYLSPDSQISHKDDVLRTERKRKIEESKIAREVSPPEKRTRREDEKQDDFKGKREEQARIEMEKRDRERRKEEERLVRERQREEEKFQREQRREIERREKFLQRESLRAERKRQKEKLRLEKEEARLKAAIEKAAARRIAKESAELIDDEQLELMECVASGKGLNSIISLDHNSLQNLDLFRDSLNAFPPKSVQLKRPLTIEPWINSETNVGNLFMVWRFLITFADVLELWPFTLDEFVQAFHDYESRLLGEIHVALLKLIINDIEDVARRSSLKLGTNQTSASNPEGGHPQIIEGALAWGINISNWQRHLNPLTWPEILRQFALSAGFGPQLKTKSSEWVPLDGNNEDKGSEDIVSTLRNGSAAEIAVAMMQGKGSLPRRSGHRLAPGTLKFAAFHVLSLEGSKGLTVSELAKKIQKSGLRDLSKSKRPDTSISTAMSRDLNLFERIAPSTYCVRPSFRKDPADADAVLSAAREKLQNFEKAVLAGEVADDVERGDDDCDVAEGLEVDDFGSPSITNKGTNSSKKASNEQIELENEFSSSSDLKDLNSPCTSIDQDDAGTSAGNSDQEITEIDESKSGELWVQGLMEGEYSDLSVEERLNALVALIGVANEGKTVRSVLEDRLEAANALKKQMWAEAQLDKKRMKEDDSQSEQHKYAAERSRLQLKSHIAHKAEEMYVYRSLPLGQDRRCNRYWQFVASASRNDPGSGRIFVELTDGNWRLFDSEEAFDAFLTCLDTRGIREFYLHSMLKKIETSFKESVGKRDKMVGKSEPLVENAASESDSSPENCKEIKISNDSPTSTICGLNADTSEPSSSFKIELGRNEMEKVAALERYQDFQKWMWKECLNSSFTKYRNKRCTPLLDVCEICLDSHFCVGTSGMIQCGKKSEEVSHGTLENGESSPPPLGVRLVKTLLALIEVYIPSEALRDFWTEDHRRAWGMKLHKSSSTEDLVKILTKLESAIKRECLSSKFVLEASVIPQTSAAMATRLLELDASVLYVQNKKKDVVPVKDKGLKFEIVARNGKKNENCNKRSGEKEETRNELVCGWGRRTVRKRTERCLVKKTVPGQFNDMKMECGDGSGSDEAGQPNDKDQDSDGASDGKMDDSMDVSDEDLDDLDENGNLSEEDDSEME